MFIFVHRIKSIKQAITEIKTFKKYMTNKGHYKCVIIGSGPSGYTASIYASRAGLEPVLFTGLQQGGQLMDTNDVDNFPGYPDGVNGAQLMEDLKNQALRFGSDIRAEMVTNVDFSGDIVVGGGDTALEEATFLANMCKTVTILVRGDKMRGSKIMQDKAISKDNIDILYNTSISEIKGDDRGVTNVDVTVNGYVGTQNLETKAVFIAIGHKPNTDIFKEYINMDENGYIIREAFSTKTNVEGVFVAGDVADTVYRQAITASGSGCMSALDTERYLSEL